MLRDVEWEECALEPRKDPQLEALAKQTFGDVPISIGYLAHAPWVVRTCVRLNFDQGLLLHLDNDLAGLVSMAVSQQNSCRFCYGVSRAMMRILGRSEEEVLRLERELSERAPDPRTAAALSFARRMARADPLVRSADTTALADHFPQEMIREIAFVSAATEIQNRSVTIPAVPPYAHEAMPDRWFVRLMRPLIASSVRKHSRRGKPPAAPRAYDGPFAHLVTSFPDSPMAEALADVSEDAWASEELPRRCKAMIFAVVAHALGSEFAAGIARGILDEEGFGGAELEDALRHLRSPAFDDLERVLVPFARETVWYQPAPVQRRARAVLEQVTPAQFVSAVGIAGLANAFCRLGPVIAEA